MLRTGLEELLGIEHPILQAPLGPWSAPDLTAAVSNAGGLGAQATAGMSLERFREQLARVQDLTNRPFVINFSLRWMDEQSFALALDANPAVISFSHGDPGHLPDRAHDVGALVMHMVNTVAQAREAADRGVDVIIAQGSEAAGFGGLVGTMALVPQVVQAVQPIPVVAAGAIADGRGVAAAWLLGAQAVSMGTRFLASTEASISDQEKRAIVEAEAEDTVHAEYADVLLGPPGIGQYPIVPRVLRSALVDEWNRRWDEARRDPSQLRAALDDAARQGRADDLLPLAVGQSAGMIHDILPADEIVRRVMAEADKTLRRAEVPEAIL